MIKNALLDLLVVLAIVLVAQPVLAHPDGQGAVASQDPGDEILKPPPTYKGNEVTVVEKLRAQLPLDARFRNQDGQSVTLGDVVSPASGGEMPTILTFNYSDCPMLCSLQLNGLSAVLPKIAGKKDNTLFRVGGQFRIVTIDLEPSEELAKMVKMRERYIARMPAELQERARKGWTFLVAEKSGDGSQIKRVADAVGFSYTFIPERAEWAHPAALIFVTTKGTVNGYVYGIEFEEQMIRDTIYKAGISEPSATIGFMNRCYHYNPDANNYSRGGVMAMRIGAAGAVVLLLSGLGLMHFLRRNRRKDQE